MCGIFACFGDAPADWRTAAATEAVRLLRHRGPDDFGALDVGAGVLVNRRLAIVDLSPAGHQPMTSADGRLAITFNGEIYNHATLRAELENGYAFHGHADTEVVLAAYARWGDACLSRLRGMFAFALWDAAGRRLLVATDRFSIKPVLFHHARGRLVVSSEVKPIAAAGISLEPDQARVFDYLSDGLLDHSDGTLFAGVRQLRPGTALVFADGEIEIHRYWDLAQSDDLPWLGAESLEEIDALLQQSVELHLGGDVEPALSLSSGLDSHVLRALVQRDGRRPGLHCFTHCFPATPYDECGPARRLAADADITWHGTTVTTDDFLDRLDVLVAAMEAPVGGLGIYGYWLNARTASEHGFKVLLDGQGADEVFAGYRYYYSARFADLEARGDLTRLAAELAAFNARHGTAIAYPSAAFRRLVAEASGSAVRAPDGTALTGDYLGEAFAGFSRPPADPVPAPFDDPVRNARYRDLFCFKIPKLLRFQDRAAMAWSVEVRVPYLDHVVAEHMMRIPTGVLLSGGVTKRLLRDLAATRLGFTLEESKLYVSAPQREWMKGPLREGCRALMSDSTLAAAGFVDAPSLLRQFDAYAASPELGNSFFAWKFMNLELWYRRFIRGTASDTPAPLFAHG